jgi:hypothetical protein
VAAGEPGLAPRADGELDTRRSVDHLIDAGIAIACRRQRREDPLCTGAAMNIVRHDFERRTVAVGRIRGPTFDDAARLHRAFEIPVDQIVAAAGGWRGDGDGHRRRVAAAPAVISGQHRGVGPGGLVGV